MAERRPSTTPTDPALLPRIALACAAALSVAGAATSQCQLQWQPGEGSAGPATTVYSLAVLSNGDLLAGGAFPFAGTTFVNGITRFDGTTWSSFGTGVTGYVTAIQETAPGDLFIGGSIYEAGGPAFNGIAQWSGTDWLPVGGGVDGAITDMSVLPTGDLIACGTFSVAGGVVASGIATWNGTAWSPLGSGPGLDDVLALHVETNGDVLVAGTSALGLAKVARWNGASWSGLSGVAANEIESADDIIALPNGDVVIVGSFPMLDSELAIWGGAHLSAFVTPVQDVGILTLGSNGHLVVGGSGGQHHVARFDGTNWQGLGNQTPWYPNAIVTTTAGRLIVGGQNNSSVHPATTSIVRQTGSGWAPIATDDPPRIWASEAMTNGDIVVGGDFSTIAGVSANNVARWDGTSWHAMGAGVDGIVYSLAATPDGSVLVGGEFANAGGAPARRIARWQSGAWSPIANGLDLLPIMLEADDAGEVIALVASNFADPVRHFDGTVWTNVMAPLGNFNDVVVGPDGKFWFAGSFLTIGGTIQHFGFCRYQGGGLQAVPLPGISSAGPTAVSKEGNLVFVGGLTSLGMTELVNGTPQQFVSAVFGGQIHDIDFLPSGDLLVVGGFDQINNTPFERIARFDGAGWHDVDAGVGLGALEGLAISKRGEFVVHGPIWTAGSHVSVGYARAITSCPATVSSVGVACIGGAGPVTLSSADLPWAGSTMHSVAANVPQQSLGVHVVGDTPAALPLPLGAPGCALLVTPLQSTLHLPVAGQVAASLLIPSGPALLGQALRSQVVVIELTPSLAVQQVTSSNALELTIGWF